jgi:hypothetical protein
MSVISGTAGLILKSILDQFKKTPEWVLPLIADWILGTIKSPASVQKYSVELIPLRDALIKKYPLDK